MKAYLDFTRNNPDFILETDGSRIQDPRFVVFRALPFWRVAWIRLVVFLYDRAKDYLRALEDEEAGHGLEVHRKEHRT